MKTRIIVEYVLAALIVLILGAFAGWYFFLKTQSQTTAAENAARGYGTATSPGNIGGKSSGTLGSGEQPTLAGFGFLSRLLSTITGGGTGVSETPSESRTMGISEFTDTDSSLQTGTSSTPAAARPPQFSRIHNKPIAGAAFIQIGGSERLRFVERSSGYVFEANLETGLVTRLTNTLVPKVYEALFASDGRIVERTLDGAGNIVTTIGSVSTSTANTPAATSSASFSSVALAPNITRITRDPKTGALFYLLSDATGAAGIRAEWNGAKPKRIFSSVIPHWNPTWLSDGRIILTQAAADDVPGYAYEMKSDGTLNPLVRSVPGLTALPRAGGALLYGQSSGGVLTLFARVRPDATTIRLPIKTIADKCVWQSGKNLIAYCGVPQGTTARRFLDDWYRGAVHSSDALWRVDASAGSAEIVYTPDNSIDMENLTIDSAGRYIAFMNAADKSLWLLRIEK